MTEAEANLKTVMKRMKRKAKRASDKIRKSPLPSEDDVIKELWRVAQGEGASAFAAQKFLLTHKYNWHTVDTTPEAKPEPMGKKEAADVAAQDAHEQSPGWAELIN